MRVNNNFCYLGILSRKKYVTTKKSLILAGTKGMGKKSYLINHAFQWQNNKAKLEKKPFSDQIKEDGYISIYIDMDERDIEDENFVNQKNDFDVYCKKFKISGEEKKVYSYMLLFRQLLKAEMESLFNLIVSENEISSEMKEIMQIELQNLKRSDFVFKDIKGTHLVNDLERIRNIIILLFGLKDEKILFAVRCDNLMEVYKQKALGFYIRQCHLNRNITMRIATCVEVEEIEMLYPYKNLKNGKMYEIINFFCWDRTEENQNSYCKYMVNIAMNHYGKNMDIPSEFLLYSMPDVGMLLELLKGWKKEETGLKEWLRKKSHEALVQLEKQDVLVCSFIYQVGKLLQQEMTKTGQESYFIHFVPHKKIWWNLLLKLELNGMIESREKRIYFLKSIYYPTFGIYLSKEFFGKNYKTVEIYDIGDKKNLFEEVDFKRMLLPK